MSLRRAKQIYCIVVISIALILVALAGGIGHITAIIILAGALPGWRVATRAAASSALRNTRAQLTLPEDAPHTQEDDRSSEDRIASHQSAR